jgi:hypothetical protein
MPFANTRRRANHRGCRGRSRLSGEVAGDALTAAATRYPPVRSEQVVETSHVHMGFTELKDACVHFGKHHSRRYPITRPADSD